MASQTTHRRHLAALALGGAMMAGSACGAPPSQPEATKLAERQALVDPPTRPDTKSTFADPDLDPPGPREPQIADEQVDATLAEARALVDAGTPQRAVPILHRCANKTPASARCDGELGIILAEVGVQEAHMRYFLSEAAQTDDAKADADLYRRIAKAARRRGQHPVRADAMATLIGRGEATVDDYVERARALSADSASLREAAEVLRVALEQAPERHDLILERGVIIAQTQDFETAATVLRNYLEVAPADAPKRKMAEQRLKVLEAKLGPPDQPPAEGKAAEGKAAEGKAAEGKAAKGKAAEGKAAEGKAAEG